MSSNLEIGKDAWVASIQGCTSTDDLMTTTRKVVAEMETKGEEDEKYPQGVILEIRKAFENHPKNPKNLESVTMFRDLSEKPKYDNKSLL